MKKATRLLAIFAVVSVLASFDGIYAQEGAAPAAAVPAAAAPAGEEAAGTIMPAEEGTAAQTSKYSGSFWSVVVGSGPLGVLLWILLFGSGGAGVYFVVDCAITVRAKRIMPQVLIDNVTEAMTEGDVLKALEKCENEPGPMANILIAGFSHVEEGFEIIQEAIATAADFETEKIMQRLTWISVMSNIAPMLGLLGTVQGMIGAFANISAGAPDVGILAMNIAQALYTTAAGLSIAIPCVTCYYTFRNTASRIILKMEAMTIELIKDLRNVEVVEE